MSAKRSTEIVAPMSAKPMSAKPMSRREQLRGAIAGTKDRPGATIKLEFHISPTQAKALEFLLKQFGASRADFVKLLPARGQRPTSTQIHIMDALVTIQHAIELHRIEKRAAAKPKATRARPARPR